ncbi:hypothetical protein [Paenibacillus ginsengarvi]|uniref:Isochorismatase family protein n=1 Tax=Paenibacillus ginsengarvi TaxID=400777 RepID=A0A3B0AY18_9BACL|nr:hypothetical protein [Paenibacillus ginsengarvi]RKN65121.1 hypothetical protein D7M11_33085 [Paenibacillus ginsengarvi]
MGFITVPTNYYQQFDADFNRDVPAEGYGGWKKTNLKLNPGRTAVVVMHAWDCGTNAQFPGWHRAVEYLPRSYDICDAIFPELLAAVRSSPIKLIHVVSSGNYSSSYPGYRFVKELSGTGPDRERVEADEVLKELNAFRAANVFPGNHNQGDIIHGKAAISFHRQAGPIGDEPIAETSHELFHLCRHLNVNHLVYTGFTINGCLWTSPGGMFDMIRHGIMCSTIRQAVTAIENKETARGERAKEIALWQVALLYGFVYDCDDFISALRGSAL